MIDWKNKRVICPEGKKSTYWKDPAQQESSELIDVSFSAQDCKNCQKRWLCTRTKSMIRKIRFLPKELYQAQVSIRKKMKFDAVKKLYYLRSGIEGTFSHAVRSCGLRRSRYKGLSKTHLQQLSTAAAITSAE